MSDSTNTAAEAGQATEPAVAGEGNTAQGENQPAGGSRTFTQEQVNSMLARERRDAESRFSDYADLQAKAARLDEIEEKNKSELEKAVEALEKAKAERDAAIAERDAKQAEIERAAAVAKAAREHGVDADVLSRMEGDVEENAALLAQKAASVPKYPDIPDGGEGRPSGQTLEEALEGKRGKERILARAQWMSENR